MWVVRKAAAVVQKFIIKKRAPAYHWVSSYSQVRGKMHFGVFQRAAVAVYVFYFNPLYLPLSVSSFSSVLFWKV